MSARGEREIGSMLGLAPIPDGDWNQALNMRRYWMAAGTSLLAIALLFVCYWQGTLDLDALTLATAAIVFWIVLFYVVIRSGLNLRMRDPALTIPQMLASSLTILSVMYAASGARWVFLLILTMIFMFGVLRLNTRALLLYVLLVLGGYLAVIGALSRFKPQALDPRLELLQWLVLAITLPWFALMGGYITRLRARVRERERFFRVVHEAASDAVVVIDAANRIWYANPAMEIIFGYQPAEVIGRELAMLQPERLREPHRNGIRRYIETGVKTLDWRVTAAVGLHRDGHEFPIEIAFSSIDLDGKQLFAGFIKDVTQRALATTKIARLTNLYAVLSQANRVIARTREPEVLFQQICEIAVNQGQFRMAWIGLTDASTRQVAPLAASGSGVDYVDLVTITLEPGAAAGDAIATALREGSHYVCNDVAHDPMTAAWRAAAARYGFAAVAAFPLGGDGQTLGAFVVYAAQSGFFDEQLLGLLLQIASDVSAAMENFEHEKRRLAAAESLRVSEQRFRLMAENVGDLVVLLDKDGRRLYNSPSYRALLGDPVALIGSDSFEEVHPADRERIRHIFRDTLARGTSSRTQYRLRVRDGSVRDIESVGSVIQDAGGDDSRMVVVSRDITLRKRAELITEAEYHVTRLLAECDTISEAVSRIFQTLGKTLQWDWGSLWKLNAESRVLECGETWRADAFEAPMTVADGLRHSTPVSSEGLLDGVWRSGEPLWIADIAHAQNYTRAHAALAADLHTVFAFPILAGTQVLEVVEFLGREVRLPDAMVLRMARAIGNQIGQFYLRKQGEINLVFASTHDALTGLPNRRLFNQNLEQALAHARRHHRSLALLFLDLDRFKFINDTLGHGAGDVLLQQVAQRLVDCVRQEDDVARASGVQSTVARLGGDEFVVLVKELIEVDESAVVARRILERLRHPFLLNRQECQVTTSVGIATYPHDGQDGPTLLKNADIAMYRAKETGRNNYQFYSTEMNVHTQERLALEADLSRAIGHNELVLHYQPKADVRTLRFTGMEALLRWQHPERGLVFPDRFIPLAEESGLIVQLGEWALRAACARTRGWQEQGIAGLCVAVNVSARQLRQGDFVALLADVLNETGLPANSLELEITESMTMDDPERAVQMFKQIKQMGVHLTIDDFGTGYSSLAHLKRFPIDTLKIDRSFIKDIPDDANDTAITQAIIAMAHSLKLKVVAEGVETNAQLRFLLQQGCDEFQGYYLSKPLPEDEFLALHSTWSAVPPVARMP